MIPIKNTPERYGKAAMAFHWGIALLIIGMLAVGFIMVNMEKGPDRLYLHGVHKATGILVLMLVFFRLLWRVLNVIPILPAHIPAWQKTAAHASHYALYILMVIMPLSGWLMSSAAEFPVSFYGWFTVPSLIAPSKEWREFFTNAHALLAWALMSLIALHAAAALKHHFIDKDNVLKGMLPWVSKN